MDRVFCCVYSLHKVGHSGDNSLAIGERHIFIVMFVAIIVVMIMTMIIIVIVMIIIIIVMIIIVIVMMTKNNQEDSGNYSCLLPSSPHTATATLQILKGDKILV